MDRKKEFEELAMPRLDMLYGTALRMTRDRSDAEDLVQDTYLKAFRAFEQFEPGTNFKAWIFKILTNNYINRFRKDKRTPDSISMDDTPDFYLYDKVMDKDARSSENPEREFLRKFIADDIRRAIGDLPDDYRITFILSDVQGFSYEEIADITETNLGTVKSRLFRARRMLQQALWKYAREQGIIKEKPEAAR